ncbi:MAG TPA: lactate utilization protein [Bryobacteraceae bacterium]|nr:lactate utilization protein [Bryobacteraceae bacterium]
MSRETVLHKVRMALGRSAGQSVDEPLPVRLLVPEVDIEARIQSFCERIEALAGKTYRAASAVDARDYVSSVVAGRSAVASNAPILRECGVTSLPGVQSGFTDRDELRAVCSTVACGISGADYALADTGTLVMLSSRHEARLISLLPPVYIALVARERLLTGLDELLSILPHPAEQTSSMVLITGPSRTADIEQILVRGVHGPGEIHVVVV